MLRQRVTQQRVEGRDDEDRAPPKPFRSSLRSTVVINVHLLLASGCGLTAWAIWPKAPEWWGLGFLSIILTISAIGMLAAAIRTMMAAYDRESAVAEYMAQGGKAKSSRLASAEDLKSAGMLE